MFFALLSVAATLLLSDLNGISHDPFPPSTSIRVFLFVRTDCPITNRYAPEWRRLMSEFHNQPVVFNLVYPDRNAHPATIREHVRAYSLAGEVLLDPHHLLVRRAAATVTPEAAVFDAAGRETYHGRIDDRYLSPGKSRPGGPMRHDLEDAIRATLTRQPVTPGSTRAVGCALADIE